MMELLVEHGANTKVMVAWFASVLHSTQLLTFSDAVGDGAAKPAG